MAIGVDIGGTNLRAARISSHGEILEKVSEKSHPDPEIALARIVDLIRRVDRPAVKAIGIGIPGRVDQRQRQVLSGGYLDLSCVPVADHIEAATGRPVIIDNDCSMALMAEIAIGAARGHGNVVMFTIGTGIGGAISENGTIVRGSRAAGQLGHITVDRHGRECVCGRRGCVEAESSGTAWRRHVAEAGYAADTPVDQILALGERGDKEALAVLCAWAGPLRAAIDTISATLDPDMVLLGGGLGKAAERALAYAPAQAAWFQTSVRAAELADDAGVIGAGLAALSFPGAVSVHASAATGRSGKRAVLVNGIPAAGKSQMSKAISDRTGWPILTLDTIKNPFLEQLGGADREFNRTLGKASYQAIWSIVRDAPDGSTFIVDAWFGFQPLALLQKHLATAGVEHIAEIWCHAPGEVLAERYAARLHERPAGHPGAAYIPELIELSKKAEPTGLGPNHAVDTTTPIDFDAVTGWVNYVLCDGHGDTAHE
ncbi:ROK family protein [Phyllobacterium zundukense]|nr:ROK family protein [Phyllobacterium zundukense]